MILPLLATALVATTEVRIQNAAARVVVEAAPAFAVAVPTTREGSGAFHISRSGTVVVVDGGEPAAGRRSLFDAVGLGRSRCQSGQVLPLIRIKAPTGLRIVASGAIDGQVGPIRNLALDVSGCSRWRASEVNGPLRVSVTGEGTVEVGGVSPSAVLKLKGPGLIRHDGRVGTLTASVDGSGYVRVKVVDGQVDSVVNGSGDVVYGRPKGGRFCTFC